MAIDSVPASIPWRSDPHEHAAVPMNPGLSSHVKPPQTQGLNQARESNLSSEASCTSRASVCSVGSDLDAVLTTPCFKDVWSTFASSSFRSWRSWQLPSSPSDPFWKHPSPDLLPNSPRLRMLASEASGTSPYLLSMFATTPTLESDCRAAGDQMHCFLKWDTWLKQYASEEEVKQFAIFVTACGPGHRQNAGSVTADHGFARRLLRKYPLKMETFLSSLETLFPSSKQASPPWLTEYSALWQIYANSGLSQHRKMDELHKAKLVADPSEFLVYKGLTSGFPQLALLAARNHVQEQPRQAALQAVYPLLALGSMQVAIFSDVHLASRGKHYKVAGISSLEMYDEAWALSAQHGLLALFEEEADDLLKQERESLSSSLGSSSQVPALVSVICAALHGAVLWYQTCPAWNAEESAQGLHEEGIRSPLGFLTSLCSQQGHSPVSVGVSGTIEKAVKSFSMLLAKP